MISAVEKFIGVFKPYTGKELPSAEVEAALKEVLELPWMKKLQVYSTQAVFIIDWSTLNYLYVSPSVKALMGVEAEEFTDVQFVTSLTAPDDLAALTAVNGMIMAKLGELKLSREELLRMRVTRTTRYIHR